MKLEMIVTVSGLSGERNAYRSVLSADGSSEISGASRWLEALPAPGPPTCATKSAARAAPTSNGISALVARSDEVALAELYDRYGRVAYGLALRMLRDEALAEDAVQEGFLTTWRSAPRF